MKKALFVSCFEEWYENRLEPIIEWFKSKDYEVVCALSDYNHIRKTYSEKEKNKCHYVHVSSYKSNISPQRIKSHLEFGRRINELITEVLPDIIYLILPPNNTARYCRRYKEKHPEAKLYLDIIDLWPESMPFGKLKRMPPVVIWKKWRNDALKIADHVFTECNLYQQKLSMDRGKTSTLYLFKEQNKEEELLINEIIQDKKGRNIEECKTVKFAYLGSMNNIIDINGICRVILQYIKGGYDCEFHAIGDGECRDVFEETVKSTGCLTYFYGCIFDELEKIKILALCDYAFNMMKAGISVGLTIKSIDYMSYGLPLINNIKGDTYQIIKQFAVGVNISDSNDDIIETISSVDSERVIEYYKGYLTKEKFVENVKNALEICDL